MRPYAVEEVPEAAVEERPVVVGDLVTEEEEEAEVEEEEALGSVLAEVEEEEAVTRTLQEQEHTEQPEGAVHNHVLRSLALYSQGGFHLGVEIKDSESCDRKAIRTCK